MRSRDTIRLANHARTPAFAKDQTNERLRTYLTSGRGRIGLMSCFRAIAAASMQMACFRSCVTSAARATKSWVWQPRNALDAIIATHSVVVDATDWVIWVAKGPHELGEYIGFDLRRELGDGSRPQPASLPEDPVYSVGIATSR